MCNIIGNIIIWKFCGMVAFLESASCNNMGFVLRSNGSSGDIYWSEAHGGHGLLCDTDSRTCISSLCHPDGEMALH